MEVRLLPDGRDHAAFVLPDWQDRETIEELPRLERVRVVQSLSAGTEWIEARVPAWATLCNAPAADERAVRFGAEQLARFARSEPLRNVVRAAA